MARGGRSDSTIGETEKQKFIHHEHIPECKSVKKIEKEAFDFIKSNWLSAHFFAHEDYTRLKELLEKHGEQFVKIQSEFFELVSSSRRTGNESCRAYALFRIGQLYFDSGCHLAMMRAEADDLSTETESRISRNIERVFYRAQRLFEQVVATKQEPWASTAQGPSKALPKPTRDFGHKAAIDVCTRYSQLWINAGEDEDVE